MGGRAAEQLVFDGDVSSGAADDLQRATEIALEMVTRYGMDATIGQRTYAPTPQPFLAMPAGNHVQAAELTTREIDVAVRDLLDQAFERAGEILQSRRGDLDAGVDLLLKRETITADDFPPIRSAKIPAEPRLPVGARSGLKIGIEDRPWRIVCVCSHYMAATNWARHSRAGCAGYRRDPSTAWPGTFPVR